jgi:hypothetical protein
MKRRTEMIMLAAVAVTLGAELAMIVAWLTAR